MAVKTLWPHYLTVYSYTVAVGSDMVDFYCHSTIFFNRALIIVLVYIFCFGWIHRDVYSIEIHLHMRSTIFRPLMDLSYRNIGKPCWVSTLSSVVSALHLDPHSIVHRLFGLGSYLFLYKTPSSFTLPSSRGSLLLPSTDFKSEA